MVSTNGALPRLTCTLIYELVWSNEESPDEEIEHTLNAGWAASDAKPGTKGKVFVFDYRAEWLGHFFEEKEVTVYYKVIGEAITLLTAKARYGKDFPRRD